MGDCLRWYLAQDLIADVIGTFKTFADENEIELSTRLDTPWLAAYGDRAEVVRLLSNLAREAFEVTPSGGTIEFVARASGADTVFCVVGGEGNAVTFTLPSRTKLRLNSFQPAIQNSARSEQPYTG